MMIRTNLKDLLRRLELIELGKPAGERREVPSAEDLGSVAGVSRQAASGYTNDKRQKVDLEILSAIVRELRSRGFDVGIEDVFVVEESGETPWGKIVPVGMVPVG